MPTNSLPAATAILATEPLTYEGSVVDDHHFGSNLLFDRDGGYGAKNYTLALNQLGSTTIRYPGGTVTETLFDLDNPNAPLQTYLDGIKIFDPDRSGPISPSTLGLNDALRYAAANGLSMTFVMPTVRFISNHRDVNGNRHEAIDEAQIRSFLAAFLATAHRLGVDIEAIELGNEWWVDNSAAFGENLNPIEYGRIASRMSMIVQSSIDEFKLARQLPADWVEPDILVQMAPNGAREIWTAYGDHAVQGESGSLFSSAELIFNEFNLTAEQRAVDGILTHNYLAGKYNHINGWRYRTFDAWDKLAAGDSDFKDAERYVTEWNVQRDNAEMVGLKQAGALISLMAEMVANGVDHANVWAIQQVNDTRLTLNAGNAGQDWNGLSVAGAAFQMMSVSLRGLRVIPVNENSSAYEMNVFGNEDTVVIFIANENPSQLQTRLDLSHLVSDYESVRATILTTATPSVLDPSLSPIITTVALGQLDASGVVDIKLAGYEIVRLEYDISGSEPDTYNVIKGDASANLIVGTSSDDLMIGLGRGDRLAGGRGDDVLNGEHADAAFDAAAGQIYRFYEAALGRAPEQAGLLAWTERLLDGDATLTRLAAGFVGSAEFRGRYGPTTNLEFVTLLYENVLDRSPDAGGLAAWTKMLVAGASRASIVVGFSNSDEFVEDSQAGAMGQGRAGQVGEWTDEVYRLYQAALDRVPDAAGLKTWTNALARSHDFTDVIESVAASREFQTRYAGTSNAQFVARLYTDVFDRAPEAADLAAWTRSLSSGVRSRADVLEGFVQSREFVTKANSPLEAFMRSLPEDDRLSGGAGHNILMGGLGSDRFIFDRTTPGVHEVADLEAWDSIQLAGFGYRTAAEAMSHITQSGSDAVFSHQGTVITFIDTKATWIDDDMFVI